MLKVTYEDRIVYIVGDGLAGMMSEATYQKILNDKEEIKDEVPQEDSNDPNSKLRILIYRMQHGTAS